MEASENPHDTIVKTKSLQEISLLCVTVNRNYTADAAEASTCNSYRELSKNNNASERGDVINVTFS